MSKPTIGAKVQFCGHDGWFIADIFLVGNVNVIRASEPINANMLNRPAKDIATHHLVDFPTAGFWGTDVGVFVVPQAQVKKIKR